jgi:hypothetical protein
MISSPPKNPHNNPVHEICSALPELEQPILEGVFINHLLLELPSVFRVQPIPALLLLTPPDGESKLSLQMVFCAEDSKIKD